MGAGEVVFGCGCIDCWNNYGGVVYMDELKNVERAKKNLRWAEQVITEARKTRPGLGAVHHYIKAALYELEHEDEDDD